MKTLLIKSIFFVTLLFLNNCFGTDDVDEEEGITFLEKYAGVSWVIDDGDDKDEYESYFRLNNVSDNIMDIWYTDNYGDCYFFDDYYGSIISNDEDSLIIELPDEEIKTATLTVKDNIIKVIILRNNGEKDITYWNKTSTNVDEFDICIND